MEEVIKKYEELLQETKDKLKELNLPGNGEVELTEDDFKMLGMSDLYEKKEKMDKKISTLEELLIKHREEYIDKINSDIEKSKDELSEHKKKLEEMTNEKEEKESQLKELADKNPEELTDEEKEQITELTNAVNELNSKIESAKSTIDTLNSRVEECEKKLEEQQNAYKEQTGKEYTGKEEKEAEQKKENKNSQRGNNGVVAGGYGVPAQQPTDLVPKEDKEDGFCRRYNSYDSDVEVYSMFLDNVPSVKWYNKAFIGKKLKNKTADVLSNLKPEEKEILLNMFKDKETLAKYEVPDMYINAVKDNLIQEKNTLDEEADKEKIKELDDAITSMSLILDGRKADKTTVKFLKNEDNIHSLADKSQKIKCAEKSKESMGDSLKKDVKGDGEYKPDDRTKSRESRGRDAR